MSRSLALSTVALALAVAAGCAAALREPPPVEVMAREAAADEHRAPRIETPAAALERGATEFARREPAAARRAAAAYLHAATLDAGSVEGLIGAVRVRVWLAGREPDEASRRAVALGAVQAAQRCGRRAPGDPRCDYWLAVALGVQARERRATALDALPRIVELLQRAIERAPETDHGGPHRVMALLLVRAPGWPSGPGDPDLGLEHASLATALAPDYPPNLLALAEALAAIERDEESRAEYRRAERLAAAAVARGEPGAGEWLDLARTGASR